MTNKLLQINDNTTALEICNEKAHLLCETILNGIEEATKGEPTDLITLTCAYRELLKVKTFTDMLLDQIIELEKITDRITELSRKE